MKKLLLYFLFFIGAAIFFIQCARYFPSKTVHQKPVTNKADSEKQQDVNFSVALNSRQTASSVTTKPIPARFAMHKYLSYYPVNVVNYFNQTGKPEFFKKHLNAYKNRILHSELLYYPYNSLISYQLSN